MWHVKTVLKRSTTFQSTVKEPNMTEWLSVCPHLCGALRENGAVLLFAYAPSYWSLKYITILPLTLSSNSFFHKTVYCQAIFPQLVALSPIERLRAVGSNYHNAWILPCLEISFTRQTNPLHLNLASPEF